MKQHPYRRYDSARNTTQKGVLMALSLSLTAMVSCRHLTTTGSGTKEAPDTYGKPSTLGIYPPYKWDDVKSAVQATIDHPWSDTYWPLADRGLAARYAADGSAGKVPSAPSTLYELVQLNQALEKTADPAIVNYLSPAEKIDLLLHSPGSIPPATMQSLKDNDDYYRSSVKTLVDPLDQKARDLAVAETTAWGQYRTFSGQLNQLQTQLLEASGRNDTATVTQLDTQIEALAAQGQKIADTLNDLDKQATQLGLDRRHVLADFDAKSNSLTNALFDYMPVTAESYQVWYQWEASSTEDYSWMGHCHGWAPAALLEQKPQRAVLAQKDGKKVLFTEGDIRGLMTKLWADQAPESGQFFGARRCETDKYPTDEFGRITDGMVCYGKTTGDCTDPAVGKRIYVKNNRIESGMIEYTESLTESKGKIAAVTAEMNNDQFAVTVFNTVADFTSWNRSGRRVLPPTAQVAVLLLTTGCRDVNPMTYHLALTKLIKERKTGFVFDRMRSSQVWNQPVFGYEMTYLPIRLNAKDPTGNTLSVAGEPVAISEVNDPFAAYRAHGTAYLVTVAVAALYGVENGPMTSYKKDGSDEASDRLSTTYTLELDSQKNIIGGEWGGVPDPNPHSPAEEQNRHLIGGDAPDFIWYFAPGSQPTQGPLNSDAVAKIHACSLQPKSGTTSITGVFTGDDGSQVQQTKDIEYVDCPI